MANQLYR